jgi:hypothetical protein
MLAATPAETLDGARDALAEEFGGLRQLLKHDAAATANADDDNSPSQAEALIQHFRKGEAINRDAH